MLDISVNGVRHQLDISPDTPLLWVLRDTLGLTGTKYGCGKSQCGACTVHLDGKATRTCVYPVSGVGSKAVVTIEGLAGDGHHPVQDAWRKHNVPQCGYCQVGQIMSASALLEHNPSPDDEAIDVAMSGNLCRCGTYQRIRAAIKTAAQNKPSTSSKKATR